MSQRAVLFAGQGAQSVGMGKDMAEASAEVRDLFARANAAMGHDLARVCFEGPDEELTKSSNTQPAIFVVSVAAYTLLMRRMPGLRFDYAAGLSSGEWTALHVAGVLTYEDTLRVLEARGRFMQEACERSPGAMLSVIGMEEEALAAICREAGVAMANLNSRDQTVLSGAREAIGRAEALAKAAGVKRVIPLNVAGAFHSPLMQEAAARLREVLAGIPLHPPRIPVVSNVTGEPHRDPESIRKAMVDQVTSSVRWYHGIEWMKGQGVTEYVECGPGKVLTGLVKRIDKDARLHTIQALSSLETVATQLQG